MSSAGVNSDINHIPSSVHQPSSSVSEAVMNPDSQTKINICDNQTNCSGEVEVLNFVENKQGCSAYEESQSACCGTHQSEPPSDGRLNGVSHSTCTGGDNGISRHLLSTDEFGGARPKTTKNIKDIEPEMVTPGPCDCENRENSCDNGTNTQKEHSSDNTSAFKTCVERNQFHYNNMLVQLEKASLEGGDKTVLSDVINGIDYFVYESEKQMPDIMRLITKDLSEPYSIYTYRYFIHNWPKLCFLAMADGEYVGAIVCKLDVHKKLRRRGYIAMLAVDSRYRRRAIGSTLVTKAIRAMIRDDCDEVVLETEISNMGALHLYQNLGFVRDKRLFRYYLNGVDALRLKLWLR